MERIADSLFANSEFTHKDGNCSGCLPLPWCARPLMQPVKASVIGLTTQLPCFWAPVCSRLPGIFVGGEPTTESQQIEPSPSQPSIVRPHMPGISGSCGSQNAGFGMGLARTRSCVGGLSLPIGQYALREAFGQAV